MRVVTRMCVALLVFGFGQVVLGAQPAPSQQQTEREKKQAQRDALRVAVQEICPVSGNKLGEHGPPIKIAVGKQKEEIFLCCKGCLKGKMDAKHWNTIHQNIAKAQGKCPVMEKPLPKGAKWTVVNGQIVYLCCPPCANKLAETPGPYLEKVDEYYAAALEKKEKATAEKR